MKKMIALSLTAAMLMTAACTTVSAESEAPYLFLDETLGVESYAIGFRMDDTELAETVSGAVQALVLNGTYDKIGEAYPDIADYLCLKADDIDASKLPAEGSGEDRRTRRSRTPGAGAEGLQFRQVCPLLQ